MKDQSPLELAQEIIYHAFKVEDKARRIALAKKALIVSKECADAYVLLAEETPWLDESLNLSEGLAAGDTMGKELIGRRFLGSAGNATLYTCTRGERVGPMSVGGRSSREGC